MLSDKDSKFYSKIKNQIHTILETQTNSLLYYKFNSFDAVFSTQFKKINS